MYMSDLCHRSELPKLKPTASKSSLEDWLDGIVDAILGAEYDHVGNPSHVADLLLPQLHSSVEDTEMILLLECILIHLDVFRVYDVLDGLEFTRRFACGIA